MHMNDIAATKALVATGYSSKVYISRQLAMAMLMPGVSSAGNWASTTVDDFEYESALRQGFMVRAQVVAGSNV